ncbi:MAG: HAD-IIIA family hydrolase [Firmicutes bacterium]|nr:HAD-IIIA family hydrolase [Bacillota bacterium]MDY2720410.1 HAD-IIIA family hydrolase [Candidatus Faecousia sp.]
MLRLFYPWEFAQSVFAIDFARLYAMGFRGLIFDIDNTLVPHGADSTPEIDALFARLHQMGFRSLMLSNNGPDRIRRFLQNIDAGFIDNAQKPRKKGYRQALARLGLERQQVVVIGDQVFTDIFGANRCRIPNILVRYIGYDPDADPGKRRRLEQRILNRYEKSPCRHRLGEILSAPTAAGEGTSGRDTAT